MNPFQNSRSGIHSNFKDNLSGFVRSTNPLNRLIVINIAVYALVVLISILFRLFLFLQGRAGNATLLDSFILDWFGMSANLSIFITRPWTMLSSIFLHLDFLHIFFNMIMLWFSGRIFLCFLSKRQIYIVYIIGGIIGNSLFVLSYNYFPVFANIVTTARAIGASGGVLAILIAAAAKAPNYQLRFPLIGAIALKWVALFFIIIDIVSISDGNSGGHFAHLGGALWGWIYVYLPKFNRFLHQLTIKSSPAQHQKTSRPKTDEQYNAERMAYRKKVDTILDKVAKSGYQSLNKEEKKFLFETSNKKNW
jgi:membrane associated rhomboid family serine protease